MHTNRILPLAIALAASTLAGCASTGQTLATAPGALPIEGAVQVRWADPAAFTEVRISQNKREALRGDWVAKLAGHLRKRAAAALPAGETLDVEIIDVDRAGAYEPWLGVQYQDARMIRDIYPPRMTVRYTRSGADGRVIDQGERKLSDLGFLSSATALNDSDTLRYEKRMIDRWVMREFGRLNATR